MKIFSKTLTLMFSLIIVFVPVFGIADTSISATSAQENIIPTCVPLITSYHSIGDSDNDVVLLQKFLNRYNAASVNVDGYYGESTVQAVRNFQHRYGLPETGSQHIKTTAVIDSLYCQFGSNSLDSKPIPSRKVSSCPLYLTEYNSYGSRGDSVARLQLFLNVYDNAGIPVTGYYGPITKSAVANFQREFEIEPASGDQFHKTTVMADVVYCKIGGSQYMWTPGIDNPYAVSGGKSLTDAGSVASVGSTEVTAYAERVKSEDGIANTAKTEDANSQIDNIAVATSAVIGKEVSDASENISATDDDNYDVYKASVFSYSVAGWLLFAILAIYLVWRFIISKPEPLLPVVTESRTPMNVVVATNIADKTDDLTKIDGVGTVIEKVLRENGVNSYEQLAKTPIDKLKTILGKAGMQYQFKSAESWATQAALARDGKWVELEKMRQ